MFVDYDSSGGFTRRVVWGFFSFGFGIVAVFLVIGSYHAHASKSWPIIDGTVIAYYQDPNYRYSVGGVAYTNSQVSSLEFVGAGSMRGGEINLVRYPLHGTVKVHYDPGNPQRSVLDARFDSHYYWISALVLSVAIICITGFVQGWPIRARFGLTSQ